MATYSSYRSLKSLKRLIRIASETSGLTSLSIINRNAHCKAHKYFYSSTCKNSAVSQLQSRSLIQVSGNDTFNYLQGLVTNDVHQLAENNWSTQYCMILNVQGRVLYDLFLYNTSCKDKPTVLIDVDKTGNEEVIKLLKKYKLRRKVDVTDVSDQYKVWCQFNLAVSSDSSNLPLTYHDPRVPLYGCRFVLDGNIQDPGNTSVVSEDDYMSWRYRLGIPEGVLDLPPENCLPLESNLALMNGVNFQKGCYIGQELTARTFHTGVIRKRIVPLQLEFPAQVECDTTIVTKEKGKNAGKFRNAIGIYGLGLLRLAHLKDELCVRTKDGQTVSVKASLPDWWPQGIA
ncbi:hypothetical protein EGW08_000652 [Elysia chlorotica]|uniref:Uncharacterized protein n=1 Tax=Elysia chlorotica TaxID=188477 RepID=A0A3S1BTY0_ELYCH|nr:hypothetical protein EGW08_000652 [Elysia chlorotica]